ncbi:hypothetical protein BpHYR1_024040 [Brachionus plicatilis]|uniref:Uncharacterized protein n=1 Tax=Brachionus plicatilis TaxID=10195 RepID=A0A3M7SIJ5_BRAPC|nr:hypothetical protein BpHYR1_024040 [Brachionus plicatilis]
MDCFRSLVSLIMSYLMPSSVDSEKKSHINYTCVDKPYGVLSFEILIQIRFQIESTKKQKEKFYLKLLEDYITVLDYLCHKSSKMLFYNYLRKLKEISDSEYDSKFVRIIKYTKKSFLLGLKELDNQLISLDKIKKKIHDLHEIMDAFVEKYADNVFILNYVNLLKKLPQLSLMRRGIKI